MSSDKNCVCVRKFISVYAWRPKSNDRRYTYTHNTHAPTSTSFSSFTLSLSLIYPLHDYSFNSWELILQTPNICILYILVCFLVFQFHIHLIQYSVFSLILLFKLHISLIWKNTNVIPNQKPNGFYYPSHLNSIQFQFDVNKHTPNIIQIFCVFFSVIIWHGVAEREKNR